VSVLTPAGMANILGDDKKQQIGDDKKQQILELGRLGRPLRRIEHVTGVRRETASGYFKAAGIAIRAPRRRRPPAKPASEVSTDFGAGASVITFPPWPLPTRRAPSASACEPYRELIELATRSRAQRDGDLAGPRRSARLSRALRERAALRGEARPASAGRAPGHRDHAGRRSAGRLWRRPDVA